MDDSKRYFRFDWKVEVTDIDEKTRSLGFKLIPNPDRYEWRGEGENRALYDKFDKILFPQNVFEAMARQLEGCPIRFQPQTAGKVDEYIKGRIADIRDELLGNYPAPTLEDASATLLQQLVGLEHEFAIASLDLVGSTNLSTSLSNTDYSRLLKVYLYELSRLATHFHGHVLKYTGDGLIVYFPAPSFIIQNDHSLDYSACAIQLILRGINPIAAECGLPSLHIRAGIDSGSAIVMVIGHDGTKQHPDLIGKTVNLACKIQNLAPMDGVLVGAAASQNLHTGWRLRCSSFPLPTTWPFTTVDGHSYQVFRLDT